MTQQLESTANSEGQLDSQDSNWEAVCKILGARLKAARIAQRLQQVELANRAQVSRGAVLTLENTGQSTVESLVKVAQALGLQDELSALFADLPAVLEQQVDQGPAPPRRVRLPKKQPEMA